MIERRGIDAAYEVALGHAMEHRHSGDQVRENTWSQVLAAVVKQAEAKLKRRTGSG